MSMTPQTCEEAMMMLPWYVNNTLTADERKFVEQALHDCPELEADLKLLQEMKQVVAEQEPEPLVDEIGLARLKKAIRPEPAPSQKKQWLWRGAAVAATLLLTIQTGLQLHDKDSDTWQLASGETSSQTAPRISIAFHPTATEAEIRALLTSLQLKIIAGPSALGLYKLELVGTNNSKEQVLIRLMAASRVVESVAED